MPKDQVYCYLSEFDLFEDVPEEVLQKEGQIVHGTSFEKGETLYSPHQDNELIYVLKEGEVMLYHTHQGKKEGFDTIGPGTLFGNFNINNKRPTHFAEATRDCKVCVFPVEGFLNIVKTKPELMMKFIQSMAERLQDYESRFKNNLQSAKETIFEELRRLKNKKRKGLFSKFYGADGPPLRLTHEQIATLTGLNRVTVTRSIKELKEEGLISIDANSGVIDLHQKD